MTLAGMLIVGAMYAERLSSRLNSVESELAEHKQLVGHPGRSDKIEAIRVELAGLQATVSGLRVTVENLRRVIEEQNRSIKSWQRGSGPSSGWGRPTNASRPDEASLSVE